MKQPEDGDFSVVAVLTDAHRNVLWVEITVGTLTLWFAHAKLAGFRIIGHQGVGRNDMDADTTERMRRVIDGNGNNFMPKKEFLLEAAKVLKDFSLGWADMTDVPEIVDERHQCPCGSGLFSEQEFDAQGIPLGKMCDKCRAERLSKFRPEILVGYDQNDVDEPIEAEE